MRSDSDRVGEDGLLEPPEPFRTPPWFRWLIGVAVAIAVIVALVALAS